MPSINQQVELTQLNTFNVKAKAGYFIQLPSLQAVFDALPQIQQHKQRLVLGGGSNLLFTEDYQGLVLYPQIKGIKLIKQTKDHYFVSVGASENWHNWVVYANQQAWYGLENLALIPGSVGAAPIQNIGAYGVEVKQLIDRVAAIDLDTGKLIEFSNPECQFAYRDSYFKRAVAGKYLITRVDFKLSKTPQLCLTYEPLKSEFANNPQVTALDVLKRVCQLRQAKLPDPQTLPNAGSFFKNPLISPEKFKQLQAAYPQIVFYPDEKAVKLAAAWLIDKAGYKNFRQEKVGTHKQQALVIVNYGETDGQKIYQFAQYIQAKVSQQYGVFLEPEVRVIGASGD